MLKLLILAFSLIVSVCCKTVCYDDLGCFTDSYPFSGTVQRPLAWLPESPQKIAVKFILYNRKLVDSNEVINANYLGDSFDSSAPTKFIVHGFLHNGNKKWVLDMKNEILKVENANVIVVDWNKGNGFPYTQATANTQVVGAEIAKLISALNKSKGIKPSSVHIIGHSLGSHIGGYAGARTPGLGRITALDPAGPYFENTDPIVRLDPTDATFVEAIHTDGTANLLLGLGLMQPIGHVDYYPNGGKDQPDCPATSDKLLSGIFNLATLDIIGFEDSFVCSHSAAFNFYTQTINSKCKFTAYACNSKSDFDNGNCLRCNSTKGCNRMGYWSSPDKQLGSLYLNTQSPLKPSFCKQNHLVNLYSNSKASTNLVQARGKFTVYFETVDEKSTIELLDDSEGTFKPDSVETRLISLNQPLTNQIDNIYISYKKTSNLLSAWLYDNEWSFKYVEVLNGDSQILNKYCPTQTSILSDQTVKFRKC